MSDLKTLQGYLTGAGLKFVPVDERTVGLLFKGEVREQIIVQLRAVDNLAIALTSVPEAVNDEEIIHNLLRATMDTDMMKVFSAQNDLLVATELPIEHVRQGSLEGVIRQLVQIVDLTPQNMRNLERLQQAAMIGTLLCRQVSGSLHSGPAAASLPGYCQAAGIPCVKIDEEKFRITSSGALVKLNIIAICRDTLVTFLAFTDMKVSGPRKQFYQRLLDLNRQINVARVALDKDNELCFIYEVPGLDRATPQKATQALEQAVAMMVLGGTAQAGQATSAPAAKPKRDGFFARLFKK